MGIKYQLEKFHTLQHHRDKDNYSTSKIQTDPEGLLLVRVSGGDQEAFAALYQSTGGRLLGLLVKMIQDRSEAEDVLQDIFVIVWKRADKFDPSKGKGLSWMVVIARRRALDHLRKRKRDQAKITESFSMIEQSSLPLSPRDQPIDLQDALENLPPAQREAITLAFSKGLSHQEVALFLNEPLGTVKARIRRGLAGLQRWLKDPLDSDPETRGGTA